ncbi:hypothetical protein DTO166G4_8597 [Paecilomyces variotii]|nr:hypothetical protein DTO166G4_8597 [Paecilomyces variotii]
MSLMVLLLLRPVWLYLHMYALRPLESTADGPNASIRLRDKLRQAKTVPEAIQEVSSAIISKISSLSMIQEQEIQVSHPLSDYGIDSLVAVEMRNWIFKEFEAAVTILELLANESLLLFSKKVCTRSRVFDFTTLVA